MKQGNEKSWAPAEKISCVMYVELCSRVDCSGWESGNLLQVLRHSASSMAHKGIERRSGMVFVKNDSSFLTVTM